MFKPFTIDPISTETSGLGLTALELPSDSIFYEVVLDKSYCMIKDGWSTLLKLTAIYKYFRW